MLEITTSEKLDKTQSGIAGEFYAAGELSRRKFNVSLTFGNTKAIDLLVEKSGKNLAVQVKAIQAGKSVGWSIPYIKIQQELYYILVQLNADKLDLYPEFFPVSGILLKQLIKKVNSGRDYIDYGPLKRLNLQNNWSIFNCDYSVAPSCDFKILKDLQFDLSNIGDLNAGQVLEARETILQSFGDLDFNQLNIKECELLCTKPGIDFSILSKNVLHTLLYCIGKKDSSGVFLIENVSGDVIQNILSRITD